MKPSGHGNYERLSEHKFDKYESNFMSYCYTLEAAIRRCSAKTKKKTFLKLSQNLQENTYTGAFF